MKSAFGFNENMNIKDNMVLYACDSAKSNDQDTEAPSSNQLKKESKGCIEA